MQQTGHRRPSAAERDSRQKIGGYWLLEFPIVERGLFLGWIITSSEPEQ